jgi:Zn-dependent protease with chaperone function
MNARVSPRRPFKLRASVLLLMVVFASFSLRAQTDEDYDDDQEATVPSAMLTLNYDARGDMSVSFSSWGNSEIQNWPSVQTALESALHCASGTLAHPSARPFSNYRNLSAKQQAEMEKWSELSRKRSLEGNCALAMTHKEWILSTDLALAPFINTLNQGGVRSMWVNISYPDSKYSEHTPTTEPQRTESRYPRLFYKFESGSAAPTIHLAFGMRRRDAFRAAAFPLAFLLLPIVITLWTQRAALRDANSDPAAAWFSYFRILIWCGNGLLLFWILGQSIRQGLEALFSYQLATNNAGSVALGVAILFVPPWIAYLLCLLSSYRVYVQVRGESWTRGEFLANQLLTVASQMLPIMCLIGGIGMLAINARVSMALFLGVYFSYTVCAWLKVKVSGNEIEALTTGELRDRVFELAKQAVVEIKQVFIMPAGKSLMANAFASRNKMVIFTDYLLKRLDKREVSAVAAHEVTHIQKNHATWKAVGLIGLVLSPEIFRGILNLIHHSIRSSVIAQSLAIGTPGNGGSAANMLTIDNFIQRVLAFPEFVLIFYAIGLILFLMQSQSMERTADAGAVRLTQDPEAVITGLLKLGRLNLMPIQWGRLTGSMLTHPSTLKRVQRVATLGQVSPDRLQELIQNCQDLEREGGGSDAAEQRFSATQVPQNRMMTMARASRSSAYKSWILWALHILPAAAVAWSVSHWPSLYKPVIYVAGACGCVLLYSLAAHWMGTWGREKLRRELQAKLEVEGIEFGKENAWIASISPQAPLRWYVTGFNWDTGLVALGNNRLCFSGDEIRFTLRPEQVLALRMGPGQPGWTPAPRVHLDSWDETSGTLRTWTLYSQMPCYFWQFKKKSLELFAELDRWRLQPESYAELAPALRDLPAPAVGQVTSQTVRSIYSVSGFFRSLLWILLLATATCILLGTTTLWFVWSVVLLLRVFESLPFWLYKEPGQVFQPIVADKTA